ncbi:MAG: DUF58 domain-containing protein [Flammeovirgaceae bacterium]
MKFIKSIYIADRFFTAAIALVLLFVLFFVVGLPAWPLKVVFFLCLAVVFTDGLLLFRTRKGMEGSRVVAEKLSNGDDNKVTIHLQSFYPFPVSMRVFEEIPHQFQRRDVEFKLWLDAGEKKHLDYVLRPVKRGEYSFGAVNVLVASPLALLRRRFKFDHDKMVPVYPSYIQMRKYELLAISQNLQNSGIKRIRKIGHNQEFELIKEYVMGDDFRTVNWKATARKSRLMVNQYQDERSQQVYSLIDKSRVMQMPFEGMSLLDYAINASLVISNIAIKKSDKAGLVTFQDKINTLLPASRKNNQMAVIQENLYRQKTAFVESDYSALYVGLRKALSQRSLLLLFTNFESVYALERQLPYLTSLANQHLLVVIFFENTELAKAIDADCSDLRQVYHQAIAERLAFEKKLIVEELQKFGIHSILTSPQKLTINTINKYLELKARNLI